MASKEIKLQSGNKYFRARNFLFQYAVNEKLNIYPGRKGKEAYMGNKMKINFYPSSRKIVLKDVFNSRANRLERELNEEISRRII